LLTWIVPARIPEKEQLNVVLPDFAVMGKGEDKRPVSVFVLPISEKDSESLA